MPLMKALQPHGWKDGQARKGQQYEATEQEAALLVALGWAKRVEADATPTRRGRGNSYQTRALTAQ